MILLPKMGVSAKAGLAGHRTAREPQMNVREARNREHIEEQFTIICSCDVDCQGLGDGREPEQHPLEGLAVHVGPPVGDLAGREDGAPCAEAMAHDVHRAGYEDAVQLDDGFGNIRNAPAGRMPSAAYGRRCVSAFAIRASAMDVDPSGDRRPGQIRFRPAGDHETGWHGGVCGDTLRRGSKRSI
jgi:hypothetical protein